MIQRWNAQQDFLEILEMPFYWRLSKSIEASKIPARLPIRITCREDYDYLEFRPTNSEWQAINDAYHQNANIGFLNPESGQMSTYGSSVNRFFLDVVKSYAPEKIYEIGCGAGFSIQFLQEHGFKVIGIDLSAYSLAWSKQLGFELLNDFFDENIINEKADFIFCNDVFEHVPQVDQFSSSVYKSLKQGGVFCFSTTNSTQSIELGDISMLEHQHVNMFTERSIYLLLMNAGFSEISVNSGSYGNTFHVVARKSDSVKQKSKNVELELCKGFFERAHEKLTAFGDFYQKIGHSSHYYVPLRCIPYLATVGNFGESDLYDSNVSWQGKYIDGYARPIKSFSDIEFVANEGFFIGSITFHEEIKRSLITRGYPEESLYSPYTLDSYGKSSRI